MTRYVFLLDVDIIPSPGIVGPLAKFVSSQTCQKCAFVIPTYEMDDKWPQFPEDKAALLKLVQIGKAQPYHQKIFIHNQYSSKLSRRTISMTFYLNFFSLLYMKTFVFFEFVNYNLM